MSPASVVREVKRECRWWINEIPIVQGVLKPLRTAKQTQSGAEDFFIKQRFRDMFKKVFFPHLINIIKQINRIFHSPFITL